MAKEIQQPHLNFIYTATGFCPDLTQDPVVKTEMERWREGDGYPALYRLGLEGITENSSPSESFLYQVADTFFHALTDLPELELVRESAEVMLSEEAAEKLLQAVPFVIGSEYVARDWLENIFHKLREIFAKEILAYDGTVEMYLTERSQKLRVPERVFFHLVENKDPEFPFAFLATYATKDADGRVQHVPLKYALTEYHNEREKLLTLLSCLNRAAEISELIADFMEKGELFHPLRLTAEEAYTFLTQIEAIENTGIICRIPNWWRKRSSSVSMSVSLGDEKPSMLGFDTLISMRPKLTVDGVELSESDI